jgi:hypothetical protein
MRPDSKKIGSLFSEPPDFLSTTVAFPFVWDEVESSARAAETLSAFFVSAE